MYSVSGISLKEQEKKKTKTRAIPLTILLEQAFQFLTSHPSDPTGIAFERRKFISVCELFWKLILIKYIYPRNRSKIGMDLYHFIHLWLLLAFVYTEYSTTSQPKGLEECTHFQYLVPQQLRQPLISSAPWTTVTAASSARGREWNKAYSRGKQIWVGFQNEATI